MAMKIDRSRRKRAWVLAGAGVVLAAINCAQAIADDRPVEAGSVSIASLNKLSDAARRLGITLPPFLTATGLERTFSFIGDKGLDPDSPLGLVYYTEPGWNTSAGQGVVFVMPMNAGAAPLSTFTNLGAKPIDGQPDSVLLNNVVFRRTDASLLWGVQPSGSAVTAADSKILGKPYVHAKVADAPEMIAHGVVNIKNLRDADPKAFDETIKHAAETNAQPDQDPSEKAGQEFGAQVVVQWANDLDSMNLSVLQSDKNLVVRAGMAPVKLPDAGAFHSAGMPADAALTVDIAGSYSAILPKTEDWLPKILDRIPDFQPHGDQADARESVMDLAKSTEALMLGGQAESIGIAADESKHLVVYVVEQGAGPLDARLADWADKFNATMQKTETGNTLETVKSAHITTDNGLSATELTVYQGKHVEFYIDASEKDGRTFFACFDQPGKFLDKLVGLPQGEAMPALISGKLIYDNVMNLGGLKDNPFASMFKGQVLTFSVTGKGDEMQCDISVPGDLVKEVVQMFTPAPPPDNGNAPRDNGGL